MKVEELDVSKSIVMSELFPVTERRTTSSRTRLSPLSRRVVALVPSIVTSLEMHGHLASRLSTADVVEPALTYEI